MEKLENFLNEMIKKKITEKDFLEIIDRTKISKKKCEIFHAFIINLTKSLYNTYLGKEYIKTKEDINGHFKWCFEKTCSDFLGLNFNFYNNVEVKKHFFHYFSAALYQTDKVMLEKETLKYYDKIFSFSGDRLGFEMNELQELYIKFNKSFNLKKDVIANNAHNQ